MRIYVNGTPVEVIGERGPAGPDGNPIGTVISFMDSAAPEDYLVCDGGVHNIAEYPDLAEFFQKQFGEANHFGGDGETTFAVPTIQKTETGMLSCIKARTNTAAEDIYSLEERIVGRWIDGRPVYRKTVIIDRFSSNSGAMYTVPDIYNVDRAINYSSSYTCAGYRNYMNLHVKVVDGRIYTSQGVGASVMVATDFVGTFDYVKTTDQPTIPLPEAETNALQEDWPGVAEDEIFGEEV